VFGSLDIGIDLGTASILVFVRGKGIVLREPSVVAVDRDTRKILAVGEEARRMLGRTPGNIIAIRPLRDGVIADYDMTESMLKSFITRASGGKKFFRPRIMVCVPSGVTSVEKRAVMEAALQAGAKSVYLIEEPLAAALGAGLDISCPSGNMVVDIGGGTTDIAVLSLNGIVVSTSLRVGGDKFDEAIIKFMKKEYNLLIGERSAEEVKITVGTAFPEEPLRHIEVRGRDLVTGLPKNISVSSAEIYEALAEPIEDIVEAVHFVLDKTPPELASDIIEKGVIMTGGGALLHNFDVLLREKTGIPFYVAEDAISCVALGTGAALEGLDMLAGSVTRMKAK
jgi:rod shape-determining protein MreB